METYERSELGGVGEGCRAFGTGSAAATAPSQDLLGASSRAKSVSPARGEREVSPSQVRRYLRQTGAAADGGRVAKVGFVSPKLA